MSDEATTSRAYGLRGPFDLFRLSRRVRRGEIFVLGAVLLVVKYGLDLAVSRPFHRDFSPLMYVSPRVSPLVTAHDLRYLGALSLVARARCRDTFLEPKRSQSLSNFVDSAKFMHATPSRGLG